MEELYAEMFRKLALETAIVKFTKSNGQSRVMLATRSTFTSGLFGDNLAGLLAGFDNRNGIGNLNMAVIDLELGDCRSFHLPRVEEVQWLGEVNSIERVDEVIGIYREYKKESSEKITAENDKYISGLVF